LDTISGKLHRILVINNLFLYLRFEKTVPVLLIHLLTFYVVAKLQHFFMTLLHRHFPSHFNVLAQEKFVLLFLVGTRKERSKRSWKQIYLAIVVVALHKNIFLTGWRRLALHPT